MFVRAFDIACGAVIAEFCVHCAVRRWRWKRRIQKQTGAQLSLISSSRKLRLREEARKLHHHKGDGNEAS